MFQYSIQSQQADIRYLPNIRVYSGLQGYWSKDGLSFESAPFHPSKIRSVKSLMLNSLSL